MLKRSQSEPNLALLWEMGTGKTGGMINILRSLYAKERRIRRTLILTPLVTVYNWKNEFKLHSKIKDFHIIIPEGTGAKRLNNFTKAVLDKTDNSLSRGCIVILNYEAMQSDKLFEALMEWNPEVMVCDESQLIKNYKAIRAKKAVMLGDHAAHRYIMSGTPILNSVEDIYMQYRFLDAQVFGRNRFKFMARYMEDENAAWSGKQGHFSKWVARPEAFEELHEKMYSIGTRITKAECLKDMPPLIKIRRDIQMSPEQAKMYKEMKSNFITWIMDEKDKGTPKAVVANIALTKALRLMQIVTGFVKTEDEEIIEIAGKNPRLDDTKDLLIELVPNHKIILWCSFRHNYKQLGDLCESLNIPHVFITGNMDIKAKEEAMHTFRSDEGTRVIIANRRAGGIGINLVEASYSIVYSRNFSLGEEKQSESRNHRGGSQIHDKVVKIDLCAKNTIDELVLEALEGKQKLSDMIVDSAIRGDL